MDGGRTPGARIGPYTLTRQLGAGVGGEVWEAVLHAPAGFAKPVALKLLRSRSVDARHREAFLREARLGAHVQHPNVVGTLHLGEHDGTWCLALELVRGLSLATLCERAGGHLPPLAVIDVGRQVAAGLRHVHTFLGPGRGLVHRDVKPSNVLVDTGGIVKLAGLGISLVQGEAEDVAGTPGYMAPEQVAGRAEPRSDLFALGALLYEIATGIRALGPAAKAPSEVARVEERLATPGFVDRVETAVPGLGAVVRACLRFDPRDRPRTAADVHDALTSLRSVQAPGPTLFDVLAELSPETVSSSPAPDVTPTPGNVRLARDAFVGRATELSELEGLVRAVRWIAIVGPGGTGKTRLALELARWLHGPFAGRTWIVDLAHARTPDDVCAAVAAALGVELERGAPAARVSAILAHRRRSLFVLDNLEQCVAALPATLGRWLDEVAEPVFVGTSRVVPGLAGEYVLRLGGLGPQDAATLLRSRAPRPLAPEEVAQIDALCAALDHVPLPIELAAARLRALDLGAVRARLSLALLAGGSVDRAERHRSVSASLAWSRELLSATGRRALGQLAVFEGGFDLAAAEGVLDLPADGPWAIAALQELVDASLLQVEPPSGRLRMSPVVREFAAGTLAPPDRGATEERHGSHFAQLGTPEAIEWLAGRVERYRTLAGDLDDVVAACRRAAARGDGPVAVSTLIAADAVLGRRGPAPVWLELAEAVLAVRSLEPVERGRAARVAGSALRELGRFDASEARLAEALALARSAGDRALESLVLLHLATTRGYSGRLADAEATILEALAVARAVGHRRYEGVLLGNLGVVRIEQERLAEAREMFESALTIHRGVGDRRHEGIARSNLGKVQFEGGNFAEARTSFFAAVALHREVGDLRAEAVTRLHLGALCRIVGQPDEARRHLDLTVDLAKRSGNRKVVCQALIDLGHLAIELGRPDEARARIEEARGPRDDPDRAAEPVALLAVGRLEALEGRASAARAALEAVVGTRPPGAYRGVAAVALAGLCRLACAEGHAQRARAHGDRALALLADERSFSAGVVFGAVARAFALDGDIPGATALLDRAEAILRPSGAAGELGLLLVARAEVLVRSDRGSEAAVALARAEEAAPGNAEVASEARRVRAALAAGGVS